MRALVEDGIFCHVARGWRRWGCEERRGAGAEARSCRDVDANAPTVSRQKIELKEPSAISVRYLRDPAGRESHQSAGNIGAIVHDRS